MNTTEDAFPDLFADLADTPEFAYDYEDSQTELGLLKFLIESRKALDLNQRDIAEVLNVSQSVISDLERGNTAPKLPILMKYARAVQSQLTILAGGQDVRRCLDSYTPVTRATGTVIPISNHDAYCWNSQPSITTRVEFNWGRAHHG